MATLNCPTCSCAVPQDAPLCPGCGANLIATRILGDPGPVTEPGPGIDFLPGHRFAGRFTVIERVGAGGMGVVYKAIDNALDAEVALKLIQPSLAQVSSFAGRFRREVRLTRQITHPNVCRVHDIGESDGILYLSMEWIEGETLQRLLRQTGTLRDARALEIAEKMAAGLEAAHAAGVIHRDLKPANAMLDRQGNVRVLDFGLAVETGRADITGTHLAVGTPAYMAPEQRAGRHVDGRADLYALGLILFEMLLGRRPDRIPSSKEPFPPEINELIVPLLRGLLAEEPGARRSSATEVREELAKLRQDPTISLASSPIATQMRRTSRVALGVGAVLVVAVAVVLLVIMTSNRADQSVARDARPFYENGLRYLREEAETARSIRNAITLFHRAQELDPGSAPVMASLGEAYWVLYGRRGETSARDEAERWLANAERVDASLPELYLARGRGYLVEGKNEAARAELEQAVEAKPELGPAWLYLGAARRELNDYQGALDALNEAEAVWSGNFHVQWGLGSFYEHFQDYEKAKQHFRRTTELKPDSITAWNNLGALYLHAAELENAADALRHSLEIEEYGDARSNLGTVMYFLGDYEEAFENYRRATELEPGRPVHWSNLGDALGELGRQQEVVAAYGTACERADENALRKPLDAGTRADAALYCAQAGQAEIALRHGAAAEELQPENATIQLMYSATLCRLGRDDEGLDRLDRAVRLGVSRAQISARPEFARLKADDRFRSLLELAQ